MEVQIRCPHCDGYKSQTLRKSDGALQLGFCGHCGRQIAFRVRQVYKVDCFKLDKVDVLVGKGVDSLDLEW